MPPERPGPLAGLTVVDCSTVLAGPFCTMLLGDLGADVIKVEPPEGDATRRWGPPWVGDGDARTAAYYLAVNRNKRSIAVDLRADDDRAILRRLIERADVLVENFRRGSLGRMGLGDEQLAALNGGLVHLAIGGYGPVGPDAEKPGYDFVVQGASGLMSITGYPDDAAGHPTKVGVAISDVVTGLFGAVSVLASLVERQGTTDGDDRRGQRIDVSILESTLAVLVNQAHNAFVSGVAPGRLGNAHPNIVPYETFATSDGEIAIAVGSDRQWPRFCDAIGLPDLVRDTRFATNGDRVERRGELRPILAERFRGRSTVEWLAALDAADVPAGPINDLLAAFDTPQARALGSRVPLRHPVLGAVDQVAAPFHLSRTPAAIRTPPPLLGEHAAEILEELGYAEDEIERFTAARMRGR